MSILIKDMEMPKSCKSCDLLQDYDGDMYCPLNDYLNFGDIENVPDYVMIGCPLSAQPDGIPLEWIDKHLEWLDNCDNDFAQLAKVSIKAMVELWKKDRI